MTRVRAYAPASIGNVAAGFDVLGVALAPVDGGLWGDVVEVAPVDRPSFEVSGPHAERLPPSPHDNLVVRMRDAFEAAWGRSLPPLAIVLHKNLPLNSGLGSSAASIVAALLAYQAIARDPLPIERLIRLAGEGEGIWSGGCHLDNVAPALLGGLQLMPPDGAGPPRALPWPSDLRFVVAHPDLELSTAVSRAALPRELPLNQAVAFGQNLAAFVHALHTRDRELLAKTLRDPLAEPHRAPLVPSFREAQRNALDAGALGCSLSGSGPSVFAVADSAIAETVASALVAGFGPVGAEVRICTVDAGARLLGEAV